MSDGRVDMLSPGLEAMPDHSLSSQGGAVRKLLFNVLRYSFPSGFGDINRTNTINTTINFCMFSMRMSNNARIYLISIDGPQFIVGSDGNSLNLSLYDKKSGENVSFLMTKSIL
jgi:hypothetical protein